MAWPQIFRGEKPFVVKLRFIVGSGIAMIIAHIIITWFGLYEREALSIFSIDKLSHTFGGALAALLWLWTMQHERFGHHLHTPSRIAFFWSLAAVAVVASFFWELFELSVTSWTPRLAQFTALHSPTVADALSDMLFGLIGGIVVAFISLRRGTFK